MPADLLVLALGGASGALLRFSVSNAVYRLLGRGFPHGTLAVNLTGSFFLALFAEPLLQSAAGTFPWRPMILTGFLGAFTTFSTFALESIYLIEQGRPLRAFGNVAISVTLGLLAAWAGLRCGRWLFFDSAFALPGFGWPLPVVLNFLANATGAFVLGLFLEAGCERLRLGPEYRATLTVLGIGTFATLSSLHLLLELIGQDLAFKQTLPLLVGSFAFNLLVCAGAVWGGFSAARQL